MTGLWLAATLAGSVQAQGTLGQGDVGVGQADQLAPAPAAARLTSSNASARIRPSERTGLATEVTLEGRSLTGWRRGEPVWSQTFAPELGQLRGPLRQGGMTYLGAGPAVLAYDEAGRVLARYDLSAPVLTLDGSGGLVRATVTGGEYRETLTLIPPEDGGGTQERLVFAPDPAVTLWAMQAADAVPDLDVSRRWASDPVNPFLGLRAVQQASAAGQPQQAAAHLKELMAAPQPFPVWVKLAARLDTAGYPEQADQALELARMDAAQRGYDPAIRVSREAMLAYGNPAGYTETLLSQGRLNRAEVWMRHLRALHPRAHGSEALYQRYAELLESQERAGEASEWRGFASSLRAETLYRRGPAGLIQLRDASGLLALALALGVLLATLSILRRGHAVQRAELSPYGGRWRAWHRHPLARASRTSLHYASTGERLVLLGLSAALTVSLSGGLWASRTAELLATPALNTGTYGGAWAETGLARLPLGSSPEAALLRGLSSQLSGDLSAARVRYQAAQSLPCARNNLGVIAALRGDRPSADSLFRTALAAQPGLGAAAYNLGFPVLTLGSGFQERYRPGQPRLCYPDDRSLIRALSGDVSGIWRAQLRDPLGQLRLIAAQAQRGHLHPWALLWLAEALTLGALLLALLPPRRAADLGQSREHLAGAQEAAPTPASESSRPTAAPLPAYQPERDPVAWLLPGSGLLEWVWGGPLLLAFVTAALAWSAGYALTLLQAGAPLPWPLTLWPAAGWPDSLPGLAGPWPLRVLALTWLINVGCLWALGRSRRTHPQR
ncbi:hypothetical protein GCM10017783_00880 [Deinococcus piscis]|uniref:Tetratricopeptide repeat protein n=1 Tax=Deinococcus piscis TaxID=394230 RepID=A0ABQ3K017_9DEIO|nr:hypothetical protein [Deinococcus piscis]GHF92862.1 hypothetical protein GCM10017783_00880 [Deinococcus piscis]